MVAKILFPNINGRAIVEVGKTIYVIKNNGYYRNQEIVIDEKEAFQMPSLLYAIEVVHKGKLEEAVKFIKENW